MIRQYMNRINLQVGWNDKVFNLLKEKAKNMDAQEKNCAVVLDGIAIKEGLQYNIQTELIDGFVDLAGYGTSAEHTHQAVFFMIKVLHVVC